MSFLSRTGDVFYAFRFLRLLTTQWTETGAYKMGLIDANGKLLKKPETPEERDKYNIFHRLVFNLKTLLNKVPLGKTTIASYLAALYLIKEDSGMSDNKLISILEKVSSIDFKSQIELNESAWSQEDSGNLRPGCYVLARDIMLPMTGESLAKENTTVMVNENTSVHGEIFGIPVYKVHHVKTNTAIFVTQTDILPKN